MVDKVYQVGTSYKIALLFDHLMQQKSPVMHSASPVTCSWQSSNTRANVQYILASNCAKLYSIVMMCKGWQHYLCCLEPPRVRWHGSERRELATVWQLH